MRKSIGFAIPALILGMGALISTNVSYGKAEYAKKEKKGCTVCHTKMGVKELNDVGKCYGKSKSLDGCAAEKK